MTDTTKKTESGEAVAPAVDFERFRKAVGCMRFTAQALRGMAKAAMDQEANALDALIDRLVTTPPAAQVPLEESEWMNDLCNEITRITGDESEDDPLTVLRRYHPEAAQVQGEGFKSCQCFTPRDKELCLHKRECSVVTAQKDQSP